MPAPVRLADYCVGTSKYFLKADTLVFTATMGGKTIATVEISLNDYSILQCRAFANDICKYTEQIANIIKANKMMIAKFTPGIKGGLCKA